MGNIDCCTARDTECETALLTARSSATTPRGYSAQTTPRLHIESVLDDKSTRAVATACKATSPMTDDTKTPSLASPGEELSPNSCEWSPERVESYRPPEDGLFDFEHLDDLQGLHTPAKFETASWQNVESEAVQPMDLLLEDCLSQKAIINMAHDVGKLALSRDRVGTVLDRSEGALLTCAQMREMVMMCSLETHRKRVIYERYAQLVDPDQFEEEVVKKLMRSNALRTHLSAKKMELVMSGGRRPTALAA